MALAPQSGFWLRGTIVHQDGAQDRLRQTGTFPHNQRIFYRGFT